MNYQTLQKDGQTLDEIEQGGLRVQIARTGAEMVSLRRDGSRFLHRDADLSAPASGWANHATVMGYFLHRLWNGESVYRGTVLRSGNHGFLRHFEFEAPEVLADGLAYRVDASRIPTGEYPLRVSLRLSYRLSAAGLRIAFAFTNEEPSLDAHVSFGIHPGFALTSVAAAKIRIPAGRYVRHMAPGNFLNGATETLDFSGGDFPYPKGELEGSYILGIEGLADRTFHVEDPQRGTAVSLDFSEVPYVTFWSDSDRFLCIEPCWGLPDSNPPAAFENKAGIQVIPPGGTLTRSFSIQPSVHP